MAFDVWSVVEVLGENGSYGSGYEVDAGVVLTACHVLTGGESEHRPVSARVRFMGEDADWEPSEVIWSDAGLDAALLYVTALDRPPVTPVRYGELTGAPPQYRVGCGAAGFPRVQAGRDGRDPMGVSGTVDALTKKCSGLYQIELTSLEHRRDWSGMSGAAVFSGPLLIAVVCSVPDGFHAARVDAVPVHRLLRDAAFREALFGTGCVPLPGGRDPHHVLRAPCGPACAVPPLESVELEPLLEAPPHPGPPARTAPYDDGPSVPYLLHPRVRTAPFIGRGVELTQLRNWITSPEKFDVLFLTGPMGVGKTRLAVELAQHLGVTWITGFLRTEPSGASPEPDLHLLLSSFRPLLLVIDYAETRPAWLDLILRTVAGRNGHAKVRLLLLSRLPGGLPQQRARRGLPHNASEIRLLETDGGPDDARLLHETAHAFARRLYADHPFYDIHEPGIHAVLPDQSPADPFSLNLAACAAAIRAFEGDASSASPYEVVLAREERYWMRGAEALALPGGSETLSLLRTLVLTQALCGARDRAEAVAAVKAGRRAHYRHWDPDQPSPEQLRVLHHLLGALYPSHDDEWGRFGPHALSAHLIESAEREDQGLTGAILKELPEDQRRRGLETVSLCASRSPDLVGLAREAARDLGLPVPPWLLEGPFRHGPDRPGPGRLRHQRPPEPRGF
ncbi:trypsin-like peptidase domain-containing protein [Streptomyces sp. NPDC004539]|uniref:trypsin-like peptidase domain-containing protein n=1 Tax=Streptomyces sp. NPDC004539 TaxID=3154280 RepID=UPI0033AB3E53